MKKEENEDEEVEEIFKNEICLMKRLKHKNIINLKFSEVDGKLEKNGKIMRTSYLVLEYAPNGDLFDYLKHTGKFDQTLSRFFFNQLLDGVSYLHSQAIIHRDLKTENLLLDRHFTLKICDFGYGTTETLNDRQRIGTEGYLYYKLNFYVLL